MYYVIFVFHILFSVRKFKNVGASEQNHLLEVFILFNLFEGCYIMFNWCVKEIFSYILVCT